MAAKIKINTDTQVLAARFLHAGLTDSATDDVSLQSFVDEGTQQRKLVAAVGGNSYVGDDVGHPAGCKYYIAKFSRGKSKLRVYDARLFNLSHYDDSFIQKEKEQLELDATARLLKLSTRDSVNQLTESFGASWKRRSVREHVRHSERSSQNQAEGTRMSDYIQEGNVEASTVQSETERPRFGPPCNPEADCPENVYPLEGIISDDEMAALDKVVDELVDCKPDQIDSWQKKKSYPSFVLAQLQLLPISTQMRRRQCCLLMYLSYLVHLSQMKASQLSRKDPLPRKWPGMIRKKLLQQFAHLTTSESRQKFNWRLSPLQRDNLVAHIIVLGLHINSFVLPIRHITADLRMMDIKFLNRAQALGLSTTRKKATTENGWTEDEKFILLKLPLKFPTGRTKSSRRSK